MKLNVREMIVFAMLGALMFASKLLMEFLPNVHLIAVFIAALTVVYRQKALYPLYTFILLTGVYGGFNLWWLPYLYIWAILWGAVMLLPKKIPARAQAPVYMTVCALHGFLYGTLYAPAQALMYGLDFKGMIAWIVAGLPYDCIHGCSNFICGLLVVPLINILRLADSRLESRRTKSDGSGAA